MKGLKIFGWICFGAALVCFAIAYFIVAWYDMFGWQVSSVVFLLASILSLLVIRALKQLKEDLELKIIMNT